MSCKLDGQRRLIWAAWLHFIPANDPVSLVKKEVAGDGGHKACSDEGFFFVNRLSSVEASGC